MRGLSERAAAYMRAYVQAILNPVPCTLPSRQTPARLGSGIKNWRDMCSPFLSEAPEREAERQRFGSKFRNNLARSR